MLESKEGRAVKPLHGPEEETDGEQRHQGEDGFESQHGHLGKRIIKDVERLFERAFKQKRKKKKRFQDIIKKSLDEINSTSDGLLMTGDRIAQPSQERNERRTKRRVERADWQIKTKMVICRVLCA